MLSCLLLQATYVLEAVLVHEPGVPEPLVHVVPRVVLHYQQSLDAADGSHRHGAPDALRKHESGVTDLVRNRTVLSGEK